GRLNATQLAQAVYRVPDPDLFQMRGIRNFVETVTPGVVATMTVDRSQPYLDPVRNAISKAASSVRVAERSRSHLTRYSFAPGSNTPFAAVEDALGSEADISRVPGGEVFRIEYGWDGVVHVFYRTGPDDARGKRDPYQLLESDRWGKVYGQLGLSEDYPVR